MEIPAWVALADRLERDIRRLRPGDPYPPTAVVARRVRAGTAAVNRALQLLVRRGVLSRSQRRGAVVRRPPREAAVRLVHVVAPTEAVEGEGLFRDGTLLGLQAALPGARIRIVPLPAGEDPAAARRFVDGLLGGREDGFVLVRSTLALQRVVAASRLPAVVAGSTFPSVDLPFVNRDNRLIGRLLARRLLARRRRRFLVLLRERHQPGDDRLLDAVRETLDAAGLGCGSLVTRSMPGDRKAVREEVRSLPGRGWAVICRTVPLAEGAAAAGRRDLDLAVCDVFGAPSRFLHARLAADPEEVGLRLGEALLGRGPSVDLPVVLVEPKGALR